MRSLSWLLRALLFLALLGFAVKNDEQVTLRYFFGYEWQSPLVVVLLLFFIAGAMAGVLAMLGHVLRQRREIARLKRDLKAGSRIAGVLDEPRSPSNLPDKNWQHGI